MAFITIQRTAVCAGGNHHTFTLTAGQRSVDVVLTPQHITDDVTDGELVDAIAILLRAKKQLDGLTLAQLRTLAIVGITVTL